ncbi:MAG TPA: hypothetical protein VGL22_21300 [Terracidiphilus sp.]|jgi:hypothetical protein
MNAPSTALTDFFAIWQQNNDHGSPADLLAQFAATFLALSPNGAAPVSAAGFGPALAKRKQIFAQLGCRSTQLISLDETPLDSRYAMARTRWRITFARTDLPEQHITVDSTFLIDLHAGHILAYLAHQDVFAILRQHGVLKD